MTRKGQVRKDVTLWASDVTWFEQTYRGLPLSNALAFMLTEFRTLHGENTPQAYIQSAAEALKASLEDRRKEPRPDDGD